MKKEIIEWIKTIAISIIIALVITTFIRPTLVRGYSMYPTLGEYDYLIINRIPYTEIVPKYEEIVVFKSELFTEEGKEKDLIKRVIGLPGDHIVIKEGKVYRNGELLVEPYIYENETGGNINMEVAENTIFVMGDNRNNSLDSRDNRVGLVSIDSVKGKVLVRLYPFNRMGKVD